MNNYRQLSIDVEGVRYHCGNLPLLKESALRSGRGELMELYHFLSRWYDDSPTLLLHTSGSTGRPKEIPAEKSRMMASARMTCRALHLQPGDHALLCMKLRYIGAMMVVVRSLVAGLSLTIRPASSHPLSDCRTPLQFAAMVPMQAFHSLQTEEERRRFEAIDKVIIGGGEIHPQLSAALQPLQNEVYSTYGMTETLSHIALRRINGEAASDYYRPFDSVRLSLSSEGTLIIEAPEVVAGQLTTNDLAAFDSEGNFQILGRRDNMINSGGVKISPEAVERELSPYIGSRFAVTSRKDARLGETVVLLIEGDAPADSELEKIFEHLSSPYFRPRAIVRTDALPLTGNGKTDRAGCRRLCKV